MLKRFTRPSPGTFLAVVALILAMAGAAYGATQIGPKKIKPNAVRTGKIKDGAVTSPKLTPSERSEGFATSQTGSTALSAGADTTVATLNLPPNGNYILNSSVELGNNAATDQFISCSLVDDGTTITSGTERTEALAAFTDTNDLTATTNGGAITLTCNADNGGQARNRVITAVRVGTLQTQ